MIATRVLGSFLLLVTAPAFAIPMLQVNSDGELTGAIDIFVESGSFRETYDVTFRDGTCFDLFDGCDSNADDLFPINIHQSAATAALLDLLGVFGDAPERIRGCESLIECFITSPTNLNDAGPSGGNVSGSIAWVRAGLPNVSLNESSSASRFTDFSLVANRVYAIWTPSELRDTGSGGGGDPMPVAEPPMLPLFAFGLLALAVTRRRSAGPGKT